MTTATRTGAWRDLEPIATTVRGPATITKRSTAAAVEPGRAFVVHRPPNSRTADAPRGVFVHAGPALLLDSPVPPPDSFDVDDAPPDFDSLLGDDGAEATPPGTDVAVFRVRAVARPRVADVPAPPTGNIERPPDLAGSMSARHDPLRSAIAARQGSVGRPVDDPIAAALGLPPGSPDDDLGPDGRSGRARPATGGRASAAAPPRFGVGPLPIPPGPAKGRTGDHPRGRAEPSVVDPIARAIGDAYGVSLDDVEIDRSPTASDEAAGRGATAFAHDSNRVVIPDELGSLDRPDARGIVAHELTHIAQQRARGGRVPDEASPDGRRLEAEARAAEQSARGDLGAPDVADHLHDQRRRSEQLPGGSGSPARPADAGIGGAAEGAIDGAAGGEPGVQRLPRGSRTPDYRWQQEWAREHAPRSGWDDLGSLFRVEAIDHEAEARQIEADHLSKLVEFRHAKRTDYIRRGGSEAEVDAAARARFRALPFATPEPEPADDSGLTPEQREIREEMRRLTTDVEADRARLELQHEAVDQIDEHFPLRNFTADPGARYEPESAEARQRVEQLERLHREHPDLVHPTTAPRAPEQPATRAAPSLETPPRPSTPSPAPSSTPSAPPTPAPAPSDAPTRSASTPASMPSSAPTGPVNISWQAGVFSTGSSGMSWDSLGDMFRLTEPTPEEREREAQAAETEHLDALINSRNELFVERVADRLDMMRQERFRQNKPIPEEDVLLGRITQAEWQAIINSVENERPLQYALDAANTIFNRATPRYQSAITAAPLEAPPYPGEEPEPDASATGDAATTGPAASGPAAAAAPAAGPATTAPAAPTAPVAPAPVSPAATAAAPTVEASPAPTAAPSGPSPAGTALAGAAGVLLGRALDDDGEPDAAQIEALDLSPQVINRLVAQLYPQLRSRLRTELLVDRERSGRLADAR